MSTAPRKTMTEEEFYVWEELAAERHQFYQGEIFAISGTTFQHTKINANLNGLLYNALRGHKCISLSVDMMVKCPSGLSTYPDNLVICDEPRFFDEKQRVLLNPYLIIEILSVSTEIYDRTKKYDHYRTIPTFCDYLLISQTSTRIEHYRRGDDGEWRIKIYAGLDAVLVLEELNINFPLSAIYERVEFSSPQSDAADLIAILPEES